MVSIYSTTVTLVPNLEYTYPNSIPITPPPITTMVSGIFSRERAPVEEIITFSSNSSPGKGEGSDPVAMITFLEEIYLDSPFSRATLTVFLSSKDPHPLR